LKPECTVVHEASFKIWQTFEATKQMGEFSLKHQLFFLSLMAGLGKEFSMFMFPHFLSSLFHYTTQKNHLLM
jgi:hypothetical protein